MDGIYCYGSSGPLLNNGVFMGSGLGLSIQRRMSAEMYMIALSERTHMCQYVTAHNPFGYVVDNIHANKPAQA